VLRFTNSAAGDLLSLTDGKNQTTRWSYDEYGRVINKHRTAATRQAVFDLHGGWEISTALTS
jgi:YD repeat-containing protein